MFQLEMPTVHSIISKMIINEELMVTLAFCLALMIFVSRRNCFCFVYHRLPWTSPHRRWSCTAQSPPPCRTWLCSWQRSWAAWWRTTSASSTSNRESMEATSTEVCPDPTLQLRHDAFQFLVVPESCNNRLLLHLRRLRHYISLGCVHMYIST